MSEPSSPIRSEDFWFEDGDIVLSVTEDGVEHHFRVHRAILSIASPVFHDMLTMPQPSERENPPPAVPLLGDPVHDLKAFLGALYHARKAQITTFDMSLGILRLSHKYQVEGLQREMLWKLQKDWPLNHSDYVKRRTVVGLSGDRVSQAIKLIETAQHCQVDELLPTAFYELACAWGTQWAEISNVLSHGNLVRLINGLERSQQRSRVLAEFKKLSTDPPMWNTSSPSKTIFGHRKSFGECQRRTYIAYGVCYCGGSLGIRSQLSEYLFDGMFTLPALMRCDSNGLKDTCVTCKEWYKDILKNKVQEVWENIPADFDLPAVDPELYSTSTIRIL